MVMSGSMKLIEVDHHIDKGAYFMKKVELIENDVNRVKEIASLKGLDSENLTDAEFWCIVSEAIIHYKIALKNE